ncbi:MAG: glycosyltransferase family 4 protein [Planctomycetes bacterium]|nr:glycosyltransferase family 4 protein [Planctomycetota bacterium]
MRMAKRVLVLTYHFPPSAATGSYRLLGLARDLPKLGWDVIVVAPPRMPYEPEDAGLGKEVPAETIVISVPYPKLGQFWLARRLAPDGVWLPAALRACGQAIARYRPAALLTSSPPHTVQIGGFALKRMHGLPWIADFRDPWLMHDGGPLSRKLMTRWHRFWEKRVIGAADRVIANAPNAGYTLRRVFPQHTSKIATVTNGFDPERFELPPARVAGSAIRLLHSGELYWGRDPRPLLTAIGELQRQCGHDAGRLEMHFQGQVHLSDFDPDAYLRREGLEGVAFFEGQVPYRQALAEMVKADKDAGHGSGALDMPRRQRRRPGRRHKGLSAAVELHVGGTQET